MREVNDVEQLRRACQRFSSMSNFRGHIEIPVRVRRQRLSRFVEDALLVLTGACMASLSIALVVLWGLR